MSFQQRLQLQDKNEAGRVRSSYSYMPTLGPLNNGLTTEFYYRTTDGRVICSSGNIPEKNAGSNLLSGFIDCPL